MSSPAQQLVEKLIETGNRIVFAESCTGGLVAAELTAIPGVSDVFCGSAVTYRNDSKVRWLGVDGETIETLTAVAAPVAHQMAGGILKQTPEATLAVSITGHFGPGAPHGMDGLVFVGVARVIKGKTVVKVTQHVLETTTRVKRGGEATRLVLETALNAL